jgi:hypothetical protein
MTIVILNKGDFMNVWIVGICNAETSVPEHICQSKETALKRWDETRLEIIKDCEEDLASYNAYKGSNKSTINIYERMLKNLQETDPDKMDNFPQDEPYMMEMELEP